MQENVNAAQRQDNLDVYLKKDALYYREQADRARAEGGDIYLLCQGGSLLAFATGVMAKGIFTAAEYISLPGEQKMPGKPEYLAAIAHLLGAEQWKLRTYPVMVYGGGDIQTCDVRRDALRQPLTFGQMDEV